jgi:hypothetical protein
MTVVFAFIRERENQEAAIHGRTFQFIKPRPSEVLFFEASVAKLADDDPSNGQVAEWSCSGLQSRVRRFDSDPGLHSMVSKKISPPGWRNR